MRERAAKRAHVGARGLPPPPRPSALYWRVPTSDATERTRSSRACRARTECYSGVPWWEAGSLCTPDDCTQITYALPGGPASLAPEGSGFPSYWIVLAVEILLMGAVESYRTGLSENPFPELDVSEVSATRGRARSRVPARVPPVRR